ncbi:MAG: hypothetical protein QM758_12415 [Armatimonas sp.]
MDTLLVRIALATFSLSLSLAALAQVPHYAPAPKELIQDVLKRNPVREGDTPRYSCAWLDLNGDRVEEAILWSSASAEGRLFDGGNRYDGFVVYQKTSKGYRYIGGGLYGRDTEQIGVLKTSTGKWLDLASYKFSYGDAKNPRNNYWYRCRYGIKGYASDEAVLKTSPKLLLNRANVPSYPVL